MYSPLSEIESLKLINCDISSGYTLDDSGIYVKHLSESSHSRIIAKKLSLSVQFRNDGLRTQEEREKELIEQGLWTKEKEDKILQLKYIILDNEKYAQGMVVPAQKLAIMSMVDKAKKELDDINMEKMAIVGPTCESFTEKELENCFVSELFFLDGTLEKKCFSEQQINEMDNEELDKYKAILYKAMSKILDVHIRKIAALPFFLNPLSMVRERPEAFWGKPISELSFNQANLLSAGIRNLSIHSQASGSPPNLIDASVDSVVNWYDQQYSIILGKSQGRGSSGGFSFSSTDTLK